MIHYEEEWIYKLLFRLEGSVSVRSMIYALPAAIIAVLVLYLEEWYPNERENLGMLDLKHSQLYSAATLIVVFLLGFRTRQAFSRFWEGTGLLHQMRGEWFDTVSNCVTFSISAKKKRPKEANEFRHTIVRLMSLCHGSALEEIAGNQIQLETIDIMGLDHATLKHLKDCHEKYHFNKIEVILHLLQSCITSAHDEGILKVPPPILSRVFQTISRGFVNLLNAKKITDTKFPFPFVQLMTGLLLALTALMPLMLTTLIKSKILAAIFTFVPVFGMFALNFIAIELENPFGIDANDLPLKHFQHEMNNCLLMLLHNNTDLISGVSPTCIMDFEELLESMAEDSDSVLKQSPAQTRQTCRSVRLSEIDVDVEDSDESSDDVVRVSSVPSPGDAAPSIVPVPRNNTKGSTATASTNKSSEIQESAATPELQVAQTPPKFATLSSKNQPQVATSSDPGRVAGTKQTAPETELDMAELQFHFARNIIALNTSLTRWTQTINDQLDELSRCFDNLKIFSYAVPTTAAGSTGWEGAVGPIS